MKNKFFKLSGLHAFLVTALTCCLCLTATAQKKKSSSFVPPKDPMPDTSKLGFPILPVPDSTKNPGPFLTLRQCIDYALTHQPGLNKALINTDIAKTNNSINLSAWLPQVNTNGNFIHYLQQSSGNISTGIGTNAGSTTGSGNAGNTGNVRTSYVNTFIPELAVSQAIVSPNLIYAAKTAPLLVKQANQVTDSTKIYVVSAVSKSFYNVLLTLEQINVLKEDTARLGRTLRDTYHQYKGGIVDETDYLQAGISLNNSVAQLKQANENIIPQYAALKQLMGYESEKQFNVSIDTTQMMNDIRIDTTRRLAYEKRIEYQQLQTQKDLQSKLTGYYKYSYLPTLSGFFNYSLQYGNNTLSNLLSRSNPSSLVGLSVSIPIFTGFARLHNLHKAKLQQELINWNETDLKLQIYKEYTTALANYKSNLYSFRVQQKNVAMARRVYFVVNLQYKQGVVAYLNVITAESNLITAEINYTNSLFQLLSSKIDLEKAMGEITY
ncbi:TolC family protein [Mucilaginibacter sp. KACC 22063]|uniref:TolC family protein n=1 Tax=Mucilaginibacter sp. KACC 22063 TaxID=3025666 RepID=UPI0023668504|nr:TolC family protein [Mucilaginibacter sp. KACC 22063]WDF57360.1 TolC family protein [Mucilaginibacter sp. KACC 22063]